MIIASAELVGSLFLHNRFPAWKRDQKTYMIPPVFTYRADEIGIVGSAPYSHQGNRGEKIIFDLLEELGRNNGIGMFVISGFELHDIRKWNKMMEKPKLSSPHLRVDVEEQLPNEQEFDFVIFHHAFGIISIEVKNDFEYHKKSVVSAEKQLSFCSDLIKALAAINGEKDVAVCHRKVIALPSLARSKFRFSKVKENTLVIFEEECKDIAAFTKWWEEVIEVPDLAPMTSKVQETYEQVLSYSLMIRHLGPITDTESISTLYQSIYLNKYHSRKRAHYGVLEREFPHFWNWCWKVLNWNRKFKQAEDIEVFLKRHNKSKNIFKEEKGIKFVNELMKSQTYIGGGDTPSLLDKTIAEIFETTFFLFTKNIAEFVSVLSKNWAEIDEPETDFSVTNYPFLELKSPKDFNMLDRCLSESLLDRDKPSVLDRFVFKKLLSQMRIKRFNLPLVLTTEQLAVFEGPCKQLIIGPPGSGKTELLKFKAIELEMEMKKKSRDERKKILYLIANGSSGYRCNNSLIFHHVKNFFETSRSTLVEVCTILQRGSPQELEQTVLDLTKKIEGENYGHVFVDEYWIGFRPVEHNLVLKLVNTISGYVWITSVFDYNQEMINSDKRLISCTKPLLESLKDNGGTVNRITQVMRATNCVINLERIYGSSYKNRSYPYGTRDVLGHSMDGLPITWAVEEDLNGMYTRCAIEIDAAKKNVMSPQVTTNFPIFNLSDIIIINFAVRMKSSDIKIERYLDANKISYLIVGNGPDQITSQKKNRVNLFQSLTRENSAYLDGNEWPMIIVILPSGVLLDTAERADKAEALRNYDPYIAFFRTMVKLVVISDKWKNSGEFLKDVAARV